MVERIEDVGADDKREPESQSAPLTAVVSPADTSTPNQPQFKTTMTQTHEMAATPSTDNSVDPSKLPIYIPPRPSDSDEVIFGQEIRCGINFKKYSAIPVKVRPVPHNHMNG